MGRVFVIQDSGRFNFSKAEKFGTLIPLIERDVFPDDVDERVLVIRRIMQAKLKDFNPMTDFLLLTGDPIAICMAVLVLSCTVLMIPVLKYDKEHKGYFPVVISI